MNDTLDWMDLTDLCRTFPTKTEYTVFSSAQRTHPRSCQATYYVSTNSKILKLYPAFFSSHNAMKLEIKHKKINLKITNIHRG